MGPEFEDSFIYSYTNSGPTADSSRNKGPQESFQMKPNTADGMPLACKLTRHLFGFSGACTHLGRISVLEGSRTSACWLTGIIR